MNAPLLTTPRVEPFFFDAAPGTRFSLYHAPNPQVAPRGAILYVHPFAEELNRTRRMAALQSRAFAELGYAVLQIDLFACGDSCGEFNAGRWEIWHEDLALAANWLAERDTGPLTLWGLRLGGLLALDAAARLRPRRVLLWEPFMSGRACMNGFLRLSEQLRDPAPGAPRSTAALRAQLAVHGAIEVGGYEVAVPLVKAVDACDAAHVQLPPCAVHWFALGGQPRQGGRQRGAPGAALGRRRRGAALPSGRRRPGLEWARAARLSRLARSDLRCVFWRPGMKLEQRALRFPPAATP
ncbi:hydrolase 2, exosortase A system-associated [Massilia sp. Dwa41.01b]|uniref:hydrolase 2, exosortase A system-associated n=1 Tax=Massilia sp. Dwa41.01b TaxID=2709302 RepID=UPI0015FF558F|nr:hydrolase 2, exosortase A system-associated [Massilia sp. Dwa41.01b]QNA89069.1 hydrolase 2, exosortase A system-associated [Massilia sp. Dwa41.01b]